MKTSTLVSIPLFSLMLCLGQSAPLGTAFTYQGRLTDGGSPANGNYDLRFTIYDSDAGGTVVAGPTTNSPTSVSNGLFNATLDFGQSPFADMSLWLEVAVRPAASTNAFVPLAPRQPITPAPYALFAPNAGTAATANGVAASAVSTQELNTPGAPANGQVLSYNGSSLVWTNASTVAAGWGLMGNASTVPGVNFLGTSDNQPLELRVNGQRALRIEPNTNGSPNFVGGASVNQIDAGVVGATIAGGGGTLAPGVSYTNRISGDFGVIGGGVGNTIQSNTFGATIGGGQLNTIESVAYRSTIGGGAFNTVQAGSFHSTIAGGVQNTIQTNASASTIGGGYFNTIQTNAGGSTIGGGMGNTILADAFQSTIAGGIDNVIQSGAFSSFIGGGCCNIIGTNAVGAVIPGGSANSAAGRGSFAAGSGAKALHDGAFVWSGFAVPSNFASSTTNEFAVRATGGVRIVSAVDFVGAPLAGVTLPAGSGSWTTLSDRSSKTNFAAVNAPELLERVARLPIQTWNYKAQKEAIRHIGPTAQDFAAAFHVGEDDKHIATVDEGGVALAAIQGLNQKLVDELKRRDAENAELKQAMNELKELVKGMNEKLGGAK